jgi:hypothetical protein
MRIGVLGNFQVRGLAAALRALLPDCEIVSFEAGPALARPAALRAAEAALAECDHVVAHRLAPRWGRLAADSLARRGGDVHFLPVIEFAGFHPDSVIIPHDGRPLASPSGVFQSRIAVLGYLAGYSVIDTSALFNRLAFAKLGYLRAYARQTDLQTERFAAVGIDAAPLQQRWQAQGSFMHAPDRPKIAVLFDLALLACGLMDVTPETDISPATLADGFADGETHPVLPDIAAAAGVAAEGKYRTAVNQRGQRRAMNLRDFVAQSFRNFDYADAAALQAADGVAAGLAALGLSIRLPPRRTRALAPGMALMSCHGTVLRAGADRNTVRHLPLSVPLAKHPALTLDFPDAAQLHGFESPVLGGVTVGAGPMAGLLAIWRGKNVLCAERESDSAGFTRQAVAQWEGFWPVHVSDLALLETMAAHDWRIVSTGEPVAAVSVRLAPGYELWFGRWRINLRTDMPTRDGTGEQEPLRVRVNLDGEPLVARAEIAAPAPVAPPAPAAAPALEAGQKRVVTGAPTLLALPMVGSAADRRWLYDAYGGAKPVPAGRFVHGAVLRRAADVALRFDETGGVQPSPATDAPRVEGQTVLAVPPGMPAPDAWIEAALRLFVLWPYLPLGARILLPPGGVTTDVALAWQELGVARAPAAAPEGPFVVADMTWLGQETAALVPGEVLVAFRDRAQGVVRPNPDSRPAIFVHGLGPPASDATRAAMAARGFAPLDLAALSPLAQMAAFAEAGWVVGATGLDLAGLAFCAAGTRVVELSAPARFVPSAWMVAGKIGLNFAILPDAEFEADRFDAITTMLANREV